MSGGLVGRVEQLLEQRKAATDGPWEWCGNELDGAGCATVLTVEQDPPYAYAEQQQGVLKMSDEDKALIVAAVNLVEPLARDWQRMRVALEEIAEYDNSFGQRARMALAASSSPTPERTT